MFWVSRLRKHETRVPTYLKTIGKSKALATTLNDTKPEDDFDSEDDGILNSFTATVNPIEDVDEEEELVESKLEKMDEQVTST